jgi:phosphoserine phosphatase
LKDRSILQNLIHPPLASQTAQDFLHTVLALQPATAVFDCDGTLWSGDAGSGFMFWSMESGLLSREASDWMDARYRAYQRGEVSELDICGDMVQIYRGLREEELREAARSFYSHFIAPRIFPVMRQLCAELKAAGTKLWAVSSTSNWVIEAAVVEHFCVPAENILTACVAVQDGIITDRLLDVPTDEGKAASLARKHILRPDAVFGNSIHDAAMLETAQHAFAINPSAALRTLATAKGWAIFQPEAPAHTG